MVAIGEVHEFPMIATLGSALWELKSSMFLDHSGRPSHAGLRVEALQDRPVRGELRERPPIG